ncbi:hypothetical protein XENOCAPTIV_010090 [Xenoophorus captivus]|uniref:Uncharacterized protein n=1 Tax=Xenoophorus captivus TaxID=1517983 RepID=A0ABV0QLP3_9TELE
MWTFWVLDSFKDRYLRKVSGQDKAFVCGPSRTMRITTDIRVCVDGNEIRNPPPILCLFFFFSDLHPFYLPPSSLMRTFCYSIYFVICSHLRLFICLAESKR